VIWEDIRVACPCEGDAPPQPVTARASASREAPTETEAGTMISRLTRRDDRLVSFDVHARCPTT
jgi:hypothetical protein